MKRPFSCWLSPTTSSRSSARGGWKRREYGDIARWVLWSAKNTSTVLDRSVMPRFSPAGIRDAAHQEWISQRPGNLLEYSGAALGALPSENSHPVFLVQDWNVGGHDCNGPPNIAAFGECESR